MQKKVWPGWIKCPCDRPGLCDEGGGRSATILFLQSPGHLGCMEWQMAVEMHKHDLNIYFTLD